MTGDLLIILFLMATAFCYEVLYAFNCGSEVQVHSHLIKFTSDQMYEGLNSKSLKKSNLPAKYTDPVQVSLLSHERTTDGSEFSYYLSLTGEDHYVLLFKFMEVVNYKQGQRVFQIKLGDDSVLKVDIVQEAGLGQILHKWVEFELREDVLYINKSVPLLNAYIYPRQKMKLTFSRITGQPKVQAIILFKGIDSLKFVQDYLQHEKIKNKQTEICKSMKYQREPIYNYKRMKGDEQLYYPSQSFQYYIDKILSLNTLYSLLAIALVLLHQKIYEKFKLKVQKNKSQ